MLARDLITASTIILPLENNIANRYTNLQTRYEDMKVYLDSRGTGTSLHVSLNCEMFERKAGIPSERGK